MRRKRILFTGMLLLALLLGASLDLGQVHESAVNETGQEVAAKKEQAADPKEDQKHVYFYLGADFGIEYKEYWMPQKGKNKPMTLYYTCVNHTGRKLKLTVKSTNEKVFKIHRGATGTVGIDSVLDGKFTYSLEGDGSAELVVTVGGASFRTPVYVRPNQTQIISVKQTMFQKVTVKWKKIPGCSGYLVERRKKNEQAYKKVATVYGGSKSSTQIKSKWDVAYEYRVTGFVKGIADGELHLGESSEWKECTITKRGAAIASIERSGSKLIVKWKKEPDAIGYKLYRSDRENGKYKCVCTASSSRTSFSQKVEKGTTYYYKLVTVYPQGKSDDSPVVARMIPMAKSCKAKVTSGNGISTLNLAIESTKGNYGGVDYTYYYRVGKKLHIVCVQKNKRLNIYTMNAKMKVEKAKSIKLAGDYWGGFYHGTDGNFYVVVGYNNPQESRTKTVIEVRKYNSKWKHVKTARIRGAASNVFAGIYRPFDAGNCQMDMQGSTLYLVTSRTMFRGNDGARHQSNISFQINTKTMKAVGANDSYVSHSFNQYVKFKDGSLYVFDHGDAYPRSLCLTIVDRYGKKNYSWDSRIPMFQLKGGTGENYTGCTAGGMEIGTRSILVCGRAKPHKYKIRGVTGYGKNLSDNIFVALTNRKTKKPKVVWLTNYNPKNSTVKLSCPRMVKLGDDRFAVLFAAVQNKKSVLHYIVVDDAGKKIYSTTYPNLSFVSSSQPILSNGYIVWMSATERYEWGLNGMTKVTDQKINRIPAKY